MRNSSRLNRSFAAASDEKKRVDFLAAAGGGLSKRDNDVSRTVDQALHASFVANERREALRAMHEIDSARFNRFFDAVAEGADHVVSLAVPAQNARTFRVHQ